MTRFAPRATTIGLALLVLLLVGNAVVSEWNIQRLLVNEGRVIHTQKVLRTLEEVLASVTEAETGERGFLITDDLQYLEPYQDAAAESWRTLDRLSELTADHPEQADRIQALRTLVGARLDELTRAIAARKAGGFDAARQSVSTNHGRHLMKEMRTLVGGLKDMEQSRLATRSAESSRSAGVATASDRVGAMLGIFLVWLAFFLYRRDLAHRKRTEELTRRLAAIVESSDDAVVSKALDGIVVSWNPGAERVYGYSAEEMIGRPLVRLYPPECVGEIEPILARVGKGLHVQHFETQRVRKDGQRIDVSLSISPMKDETGRVIGACAIARDITERKTLQREVLEIAAQEQRRIGQDLHDGIGQELTGLALMSQCLAGTLAKKGAPEADAAAKIVSGLEETLHHVRALSRGLVPVDVGADGLMIALAQLCERTNELHDITCSFHCGEPVCILDNQTATHLFRMTQEALTNAIKHGRARQIDVTLSVDGDLVTLEIGDDGIGLTERDFETAGSGLRIMRYRAGLIGAKLAIGPAAPQGTRVTCTLDHHPLLAPPPAPAFA
jgi:PAS domain S-box-containing protein